jgi:hypothetical protein
MASIYNKSRLGLKPPGPIPLNKASQQSRGLVAHWGFLSSDSNVRFRDLSGNGNTLLAGGAGINKGAGRLGPSLTLNGSQKLSSTPLKSGGFFSDSITVSTWVKFNALGTGTTLNNEIFERDADTSNWGFQLIMSGPKLTFYLTNQVPSSISMVGNTSLIINKWYHIAVTYDISTQVATTFVNGLIDNAVTLAATSIRGSGSLFTVGASSANARYFNGAMDDFRVYDRALSSKELLDVYQNPLSIFTSQGNFLNVSDPSGALLTQTCAAIVTSIPTFSSTFSHSSLQSALATATSTASIITSVTVSRAFTTASYNTTSGSISFDGGLTWSSVTYSSLSVYGRKFNGSYWLGVSSSNNTALKSSDGVSWTSYNVGTNFATASTACIAWSPALGLWVTGWNDGTIYTSTDGQTWTSRTPANTGQRWGGCAWSPSLSKFVIVGLTSAVFNYSSDGITWYSSGISQGVVNGSHTDVIWTGSAFVVADNASTAVILRSTDGVNWVSIAVPTNNYWYLATNGSGTVVTSSDYATAVLTSTDHGATWSSKSLPGSSGYRWGAGGVAYNGIKFLAAAYDTTGWYTSTDGITWTQNVTGILGALQASSSWVPTFGVMNTLSALATSTVLAVKNWIVGSIRKATPTSSYVIIKDSSVTKSQVSTSTSSSKKDSFFTKLANSTSVATVVATIGSVIKYYSDVATSTVTGSVSKLVNKTLSLVTTSSGNTSKAALLNKSVLVSSLPVSSRLVAITKLVIEAVVSSIVKNIGKTISFNSITTSIASAISLNVTRFLSAIAGATSAGAKVFGIDVTKSNATPTSNGSITKVPALERLATPTSTGSVSRAVSIIRSYITTSFSSFLTGSSRYVTAITNSIATASIGERFMSLTHSSIVNTSSFIQKIPSVINSVVSLVPASITKVSNVTKAAVTTSTSSVHKAVSIVREWISMTTATMGDVTQLILAAIASSTGFISHNVYVTIQTAVATSIGRLGELVELVIEAIASSTGSITKLSSMVKDTAYATSYAFYSQAVSIVRIAIVTSTGRLGRASEIIGAALVSATASIRKLVSTTAVTGLVTLLVSKLLSINAIRSSTSTSTGVKITLVAVTKDAISSTVLSISKAIAVIKSATSSAIGWLDNILHPLVSILYTFFVTIFGSSITDQEVIVTEPQVTVELEGLARFVLEVEGTPRVSLDV